ncbi:methyltransferase family protein [Nioella nitratireducens]|uniref:methyltransferase family protein n=1 Tax=Nioella nitratireducens TaxID=1287720 RepID=UPI0008FD5967|nr:methyltransferase [Nioella nitratireducens]
MTLGLILGLGAPALWVGILAMSDRQPGHGPWPPRQGNLLTAIWAWGLTALIYVGLLRIWIGPPLLPDAVRLGLGLPLAVLGSVLHGWATAALGLKATSGWDFGVVISGPYGLSRHPQYLGQIVSLWGLVLIIATGPALAIGLAATIALLYAARVEDRALAARHPARFAAISAHIPFLLPIPSRP